MSDAREEVKLQDGTLIRHRVAGYEGRIDGITSLRVCFTQRGNPLGNAINKQTFQYRVLIRLRQSRIWKFWKASPRSPAPAATSPSKAGLGMPTSPEGAVNAAAGYARHA
jgi:hypothetical protein